MPGTALSTPKEEWPPSVRARSRPADHRAARHHGRIKLLLMRLASDDVEHLLGGQGECAGFPVSHQIARLWNLHEAQVLNFRFSQIQRIVGVHGANEVNARKNAVGKQFERWPPTRRPHWGLP